VRSHLASLVEDFRHHADDTAVVAHHGIRRYKTSYGELAKLTGRFAAELDKRGISPGERVVLWGANSAEWIAAFFGCLMRGVMAVPLDAAGSPEFAQRVIKDVSPKLIVGDVVLVHKFSEPTDVPCLWLAELDANLPPEPNYTVSESVTSQTPIQIVFTSGTTSEPKGIVHTHANVLASTLPIEKEIGKYLKYERWVHPLRFLQTLPLSHVFGQFMGLWLPPLLGAEVHFAEQLEARRVTDLLRRERISVLVAVPRVLELLRTHLLGRFENLGAEIEGASQLSRLKKWWHFRRVHSALGWKFWAVISGGAAVGSDLEVFWNGIGIGLIQGYGMTETTALVTLNYPFKIAQGTIGKALPGREVRLSEEGEILVKGDMLAAGTWKAGGIQPREGEWLATGDLGAKNERGELQFLRRKDDMIVTGGGMNIHPEDLEAAMKKQPTVSDCVVVPCSTPSGPEPIAVVLSTGTDAQLHEAVLGANRELADFQQIRRALRWPEPRLPHTSTGKLLRRKVAAWACEEIQGQRQAKPHSGTESHLTGTDIVLDVIAEVSGESIPDAKDSMRLTEDFHLDSLGRVQLQSSLEQRLDLELPDDALAAVETLGDLRAILAQGGAGPAAADGESAPDASAAGEASEAANVEPVAAPPVEGPGAAGEASQPKDSPAMRGSEVRAAKVDKDLKALTSDRLYPKWPWNWLLRMIRSVFLELVSQPLVWLLGRPRVVVRGTGKIPDGPLLIIANHVSAYDGALVLYALPGRLRRRTTIAMSGEMLLDYRVGRNQGNLFLNLAAPPQYWLVTALYNVFPMPRMHGFRKSFFHAGEAMDRGYSVMVFPEGARYYEGAMRSFRQGIGLMAQEGRVPVLPVALVGLQEAHKSGWFRSNLLEIRLGDVIPVDDAATPAELTTRFEDAVRKLLA
jgi:long-chain acyl-CoA synthetase